MRFVVLVSLFALAGCSSPEGSGLRLTPEGGGPRVKFDVFHEPLPELPLPNDFATRYDALTPTHRKLNISVAAAKATWEQKTRAGLNDLDGWGTLAPVTVSFDAPLDLDNLLARHRGDRYDPMDDAVLVLDITPGSPERCQPVPLDLGEGLFPNAQDDTDFYPDDPRGQLTQLPFEEVEEDLNGNGVLDPGEDTDMDGVLDHPNTHGGQVLEFYEKETNTLILKPVMPMREGTTYAVVLTNRLVDTSGSPVQSPFAYVNHTSQSRALSQLPECLGKVGLAVDDVAFTWSFTTQTWTRDFKLVRDGLYGLGPLASLSTEYPAEITHLHDAFKRTPTTPPDLNLKIARGEQFLGLVKTLLEAAGSGDASSVVQAQQDALKFVDFFVTGTIDSPQFFPRTDADGKLLPLYDQVWQVDAARGTATHRPEGVNFWLSVPKFRKGPAPVAVFIHGHGGSKFTGMVVMGDLARQGVAVLSIDGPGHGADLDPITTELVVGVFKRAGLDGLAQGLIDGRALDQNGDGKLDSGADYWSSYLFHTRDMVRQTVVDTMQAVRTLKAFDGRQRWKYDVDRNGEVELAGDFDADGQVDVGGNAPVYMIGGSLGGILASHVAGLEPRVKASVALVPGGVLGEIGGRSTLGGVRAAMVLRMMGPLMLVHPDGAGQPTLFQMLPDLTNSREVKVATLPAALVPGTLAVLTNLKTGDHRCARVQPNGHLRVAVSSDEGDGLRLDFYDTELPSEERTGCLPEGTPSHTVEAFEGEVSFQAQVHAAGSPLVALGDGFGLRRGNPELRRMLNLAQISLESADPANSAPFLEHHRTLTYGTGETVGAHQLLLPVIGDSGVSISAGIALARAAGYIDFRTVDPRYGKSQQQVLLDTGVVEGVEGTRRYLDGTGRPVLMDVDHLAAVGGWDDGKDVPRLDPPLRLVRQNHLGGWSGLLLPMLDPQGQHGFAVPDPDQAFDQGTFLVQMMARYLATGGKELPMEGCQERAACSWAPPLLP